MLLVRAPGRDTSVSWEEQEPEPEVELSCGKTNSDVSLTFPHRHNRDNTKKNKQGLNVEVHPKVSLIIKIYLDISANSSATDRPGAGPVLQHIQGPLITPLLTMCLG